MVRIMRMNVTLLLENVSSDRNYTDNRQSGVDATVERVGDIKGEPPINKAIDRNTASKMANLLEGLEFPATKENIKSHLNKKSPTMGLFVSTNPLSHIIPSQLNLFEYKLRNSLRCVLPISSSPSTTNLTLHGTSPDFLR